MATETPDNRQALAAGTELLWYRIRGILGQGAFGITYLADDLNLGRPVALKEYLPLQLASRAEDGSVVPISEETCAEFDNGLQRFINEAKTLAKFEHPNIVRVHNVFEFGHTAYMVMNYEEGETLAQRLKRDKRLDEPELLAILLPLLEGLEAMHAAGFIHRDIKPGNIFIRTDGTPVLIDFGSARDAMQGDARTITNFVSPGYAPIEQYTSKSDKQGPWSDIYALGATVYRCITGRAPVPAVDRGEAIAQDDGDTYRPGEIARHGGYSEPLLRAVDHALQFRINDRPQTIAAWRHDFSPAAGGGDRSAALDATRPARRKTRRPAPTAAVLALLAVLGAGLYFIAGEHGDRGAAPIVIAPRLTPATLPDGASAAPALAPAEAAEVARLLEAAARDIAALRLTSPAGNNALEKYRQALALDPSNAAANAGISRVGRQYVALTHKALADGRLKDAQRYLQRASDLSPGHPDLIPLQAALADARNSVTTVASDTEGPGVKPGFKDRLARWKRGLGDFARRQPEPPADSSRGDDLVNRLGGETD